MPQIKQTLTREKATRVAYSIQKIVIMAQVLQYEHANELDVDFKMPIVNNFAKRIGTDAEAIISHIKRLGRVLPTNYEAVEEYSAAVWKILDLLIGRIPLEGLVEFYENLEKELVAVDV